MNNKTIFLSVGVVFILSAILLYVMADEADRGDFYLLGLVVVGIVMLFLGFRK